MAVCQALLPLHQGGALQSNCIQNMVRRSKYTLISPVGSVINSNFILRRSSKRFATSSSTNGFVPNDPPKSNGIAIYPDINIMDGSISSGMNAHPRNIDEDAVFVVTGASRGIGNEMVKGLLSRTRGRVIACCRNPDNFSLEAGDDVQIQNRLVVLPLDLEDQYTIEQLAETIKQKFNRVDGLFNVAGLLGDGKSTPGPERSLSALDRTWVEKGLAVNVVGPVMMVQALSPFMKTKNEKRETSVVVNVSARVGSISDNGLGGWYSYRFSKAALNQATRTMAHELKRQGTLAIAVHPGTTATDLSEPFSKNVKEGSLFPKEFTVSQILNIIDSLDTKHSGGLYDWAGKAIPF